MAGLLIILLRQEAGEVTCKRFHPRRDNGETVMTASSYSTAVTEKISLGAQTAALLLLHFSPILTGGFYIYTVFTFEQI